MARPTRQRLRPRPPQLMETPGVQRRSHSTLSGPGPPTQRLPPAIATQSHVKMPAAPEHREHGRSSGHRHPTAREDADSVVEDAQLPEAPGTPGAAAAPPYVATHLVDLGGLVST